MICVLCYVMCYVIKTLGKKELVTMNNRMVILGIDPNLDCPFIGQFPKI